MIPCVSGRQKERGPRVDQCYAAPSTHLPPLADAQVCEALKLLMDPDTMEAPVEKNEFLDVFYDKYLDKMTEVILR